MADNTPGYSVPPRKAGSCAAMAANSSGSHARAHRSPRIATLLGSTSVICALAALSACSPVPNLPPAPPQPAADAGLVSNLTPYRIQVGDILDVRLQLNPELN